MLHIEIENGFDGERLGIRNQEAGKMQRKLFDIFYSRIEVFYEKLPPFGRSEEQNEETRASLKRVWEEYLLSLGLKRIEGVVDQPPSFCREDSVVIRCPLLNKDAPRSWLVIPQDLALRILALGTLP
jgi:hypothetical protein